MNDIVKSDLLDFSTIQPGDEITISDRQIMTHFKHARDVQPAIEALVAAANQAGLAVSYFRDVKSGDLRFQFDAQPKADAGMLGKAG